MKIFPDIAIRVPEILLPKPGTDLTKWAVIACDQFTSQPEYWENVRNVIGESPSTYNLILPEVFLGKPEEQVHMRLTKEKMSAYLSNGTFISYEGFVLVERSVREKTRHGLVLALDLEQYDYNKGSQSLIRATEGTILQRLPPRMKIREGALLELPHILVLIDDPLGLVIEPLARKKEAYEKLYDFDLMLGSGHLTGYGIKDNTDIQQVADGLSQLAAPETFKEKYQLETDTGVLLFAMGDGNHSLATAKAIWEKIKSQVGMDHPARYALVEIENIHDAGLEFEPIHRVIFDVHENPLEAMKAYFGEGFEYKKVTSLQEMTTEVDNCQENYQGAGMITADGYGVLCMPPRSNLPVGTIQAFLDEWLAQKKAGEIDYVHGLETVADLGARPGNLGIYLPAMEKSELFKTVILDGALPRKTFSMGEAHEKRFYMEARRITDKPA